MKKTLIALFTFALISFAAFADNVNLTWDASTTPGVSYRVYQSLGGNPFSVVLETGTTTSTTLTITTITRFYVTAFDVNGESVPSNIITYTPVPLPPAAPTNLRANTLSASRIDLQWNAVDSQIASILVERNQQHIATVPRTQTFYMDTGLRKNRIYTYRIRGNNTGYSATVTARTFRH